MHCNTSSNIKVFTGLYTRFYIDICISPKKFCRFTAGGVDSLNWRNRWWYLPRRCTSVIFDTWEFLNEYLHLEFSCVCLVTVSECC